MKVKEFNSIDEYDWQVGSYVVFKNEKAPLLITLPCGHRFRPDDKWTITHIDNPEKITILPSIFCYGSDNTPCWHGYLVDGELKEV